MNLENLKIKELREYLNLTQSQFSDEIGIKQGSYSDIERGKIGISGEILKVLIKKYRISPIWIYEGVGDMFLNTNTTENSNLKGNLKGNQNDDYIEVPMYDAVAYGGNMRKGKDFDEVVTQIGTVRLSQSLKGATGAMFVRDDSMYPLYPNSCCVVFKNIINKQIIVYGRDYIVETEDFRVVKRLLKGKTKDKLLAVSINTERWEEGEYQGTLIYEPFEIPIEAIVELSLVLDKL